ncbi:MAG: nucleotidyltransferase domain-containing protein [Anaerolineales bacterium]|nr:nucleotidyltransferase domain-containing protein [Anaerolineales bacterium]
MSQERIADERVLQVLAELRTELSRVLGPQLDRLILFGSRARGEAQPDSDVDVLVVINGPVDYASLIPRTSEVVARLSLAHDLVISRTFVSCEDYASGQSPFLRNVRHEGIAL